MGNTKKSNKPGPPIGPSGGWIHYNNDHGGIKSQGDNHFSFNDGAQLPHEPDYTGSTHSCFESGWECQDPGWVCRDCFGNGFGTCYPPEYDCPSGSPISPPDNVIAEAINHQYIDVEISWDGTNNRNVTYNVYRGNISSHSSTCNPSLIVSGISTPHYIDNLGEWYGGKCYVITTVENGVESSYSLASNYFQCDISDTEEFDNGCQACCRSGSVCTHEHYADCVDTSQPPSRVGTAQGLHPQQSNRYLTCDDIDLVSCLECTGDIAGCTIEGACTYNPSAECNDGSCVYPEGCNYWCPGDGGSPQEVDCACECGGNAFTDNCGICVTSDQWHGNYQPGYACSSFGGSSPNCIDGEEVHDCMTGECVQISWLDDGYPDCNDPHTFGANLSCYFEERNHCHPNGGVNPYWEDCPYQWSCGQYYSWAGYSQPSCR